MSPPPAGSGDDRAARTTVVVVRDFDGYFEGAVRASLARVKCPYERISVRAGPYLPDAVQFEIHGAELRLTFYSGLRHGFGQIDWATVDDLVAGRPIR